MKRSAMLIMNSPNTQLVQSVSIVLLSSQFILGSIVPIKMLVWQVSRHLICIRFVRVLDEPSLS